MHGYHDVNGELATNPNGSGDGAGGRRSRRARRRRRADLAAVSAVELEDLADLAHGDDDDADEDTVNEMRALDVLGDDANEEDSAELYDTGEVDDVDDLDDADAVATVVDEIDEVAADLDADDDVVSADDDLDAGAALREPYDIHDPYEVDERYDVYEVDIYEADDHAWNHAVANGIADADTVAPDAGSTVVAVAPAPVHAPARIEEPPVAAGLTAHRKIFLVALAFVLLVVGSGAGYAVALLQPTRYAARAEVLYELAQENPTGFLREDRNLTTQLVLLRSRSVLEPVATKNAVTVEDLQKALHVTVVETSEIIRIEMRHADKAIALALVRDVSDTYLALARAQGSTAASDYLSKELVAVRAQITEQRAKIDALLVKAAASATTAATTASNAEVVIAQTELQSLSDREKGLLEQINQLTVEQLTKPRIDLLVPGYALDDPVSPRPLFTAAAAGLTALVIAAGAVAFLGRRWARH